MAVTDPVLARRARIARWVELGQRVGYTFLSVAIVAFVVGAVRGFTDPVVFVVTASLAVTTLVLAPAIVFGYGVKAAEREDRREGR